MSDQSVAVVFHRGGLDFWDDALIAGGVAAVARTVAAPLLHVNTLYLRQEELVRTGCAETNVHSRVSCLRSTVAADGAGGLWRGNAMAVLRYAPFVALNFAFKGQFQRTLNYRREIDGTAQWAAANAASGGMAGLVSTCIAAPFGYALSQREGLPRILDPGPWLLRECARASVFAACYFGLYDSLKAEMSDALFPRFMLGWAATIVALRMSDPFDPARVARTTHIEHTVRRFVRVEEWRTLIVGRGGYLRRGLVGAAVLCGVDAVKPDYTRWRYG